MAGDPWKHRSAGMLCAACMYFVPKGTAREPHPNAGRALGRCRRHAPTMSGFPAVFDEDWCGDHKLDVSLPEEPSPKYDNIPF